MSIVVFSFKKSFSHRQTSGRCVLPLTTLDGTTSTILKLVVNRTGLFKDRESHDSCRIDNQQVAVLGPVMLPDF